MKNPVPPTSLAAEQLPITAKPSPFPPNSESDRGVELSRHVGCHYLHETTVILLDCIHELPSMKQRTALTNFIGTLQVAEQRLRELDLGDK